MASGTGEGTMGDPTMSTTTTTSAANTAAVATIVPTRLYSVGEAAKALGLSKYTVREYTGAGHIPTVELPPFRPRPGAKAKERLRRVLILGEDLIAFIRSRRTKVVTETVRYIPAETDIRKLMAEADAMLARTEREIAGNATAGTGTKEAIPTTAKRDTLPPVAAIRAELERRRAALTGTGHGGR
jgi:hypothetical protein